MQQMKMSKPNRYGLRYATVSIPEKEGRALIQKGTLGESWETWRITKIVTPPKCHKCQRIGHKRNMRAEKEEGMTCYKCRERGHLCNDTNKADTMACPRYIELVREEKE